MIGNSQDQAVVPASDHSCSVLEVNHCVYCAPQECDGNGLLIFLDTIMAY